MMKIGCGISCAHFIRGFACLNEQDSYLPTYLTDTEHLSAEKHAYEASILAVELDCPGNARG